MSSSEPAVDKRLTARLARRQAKKELAEAMKDEGNELFRKGQYAEACDMYIGATDVYGERAVYLNNIAAVMLKRKLYKAAESAASDALQRSPSLLKARYRRGLARKEMGTIKKLELAMQDFDSCVKQDPKCTEAAMQYELTGALLLELRARPFEEQAGSSSSHDSESYDDEESGSGDDAGSDAASMEDEEGDSDEGSDMMAEDLDTTGPPYDLSDLETDVESTSSDFELEGRNGVPCKHYNHDGCPRGRDCTYRHAPDEKSVRDRLGRNICLYWLLDVPCRFGKAKCVYAHERKFLPAGWWDFPAAVAEYRETIEWSPWNRAEVMPALVMMLTRKFRTRGYGSRRKVVVPKNAPQPSKRGKGKGKASNTAHQFHGGPQLDPSSAGRGRGPGRGRGRGRGGGRARTAQPSGWLDADELEQRMANFGFTDLDVMELASQGVKPWDDDAHDVMSYLNGGY